MDDEHQKLAITGSKIGLWNWNICSDEVFYSEIFEELLGYSPNDFSPIPDEFWKRLHSDDYANVKQAIVNHLKKQDPYYVDCRIQTKSGEYRWFHACGQAIWNDMGKATRMSGALIDITKRKQVELELLNVQEYLDIILLNIPMGVAILEGPEFRYFRINKVLADLNGLSVEEHLGKPLKEVLPKVASTILPNLRKVLESGEAIAAHEFNIQSSSNKLKEVNLIDWHFPIRVDGRLHAVGAIVMDITERKLSEKKIAKQQEELEKVNQELIEHHKNLEKLIDIRTTKLADELLVRKEAEQKFSGLLNAAPDAIVIINVEGKIQIVNRQTENVFGYAKEELIGKAIECLMPERFRGKHVDLRVGYAKAPTVREMGTNLELFGLRKDGSKFPIDVSISPMHKEKNELIIAILRDITKRKESEKLLKESEAFFRMIHKYAPIMIDSFDNDGKCILWNQECEKIFGWTEEEIFSHENPLELFYPDPEIRKQVIKAVISSPEADFIEWRPKTKDGRELTSLWANFKLPDGKIINLGYDITERKKQEVKLLKSEEGYRNLMEHSPLAIEILTPEGKISKVNSSWKQLWGFDNEATTQVMESYNMITDPQIRDLGIMPLVEKAFEGQSIILPPVEYNGMQTIKDFNLKIDEANKVWIQCHLYSVKDQNGHIEYVVNTYVDLTNLRHVEEKARKQKEILTHFDRKSRMELLSGSIAHELNQPLTGILSNAQAAQLMLEHDKIDLNEFGAIIADVIADTKRAGRVIHNLRELYTKQDGKLLPVDVNTIVEETINLLHSELVTQQVQITKTCASNIPMVNGNPTQIQQVIVNLIINAIDAMQDIKQDDRQLMITTKYRADEVLVLVEDCGVGINADIIDDIFDLLETWKPDGMGMGLAISNSIIEAHGGRMWAENRPKGGACVGFTLPILNESDQV